MALTGGEKQNTATLEEDGTFKRTLEIYEQRRIIII